MGEISRGISKRIADLEINYTASNNSFQIVDSQDCDIHK